ncbi:type II toxin-antitoxin system VapC family toxin [Methyloprofundus sedimenti]|uniref:type II toxin-antitoxin system VapC family toxin n=1 Tax=Methyloprofundus sedimenti TaxID=1420851 RepID=UPI001E524247|nr:type II toxin-antitoxin system VapC family toxin [Methyloprofundus sedimenti]
MTLHGPNEVSARYQYPFQNPRDKKLSDKVMQCFSKYDGQYVTAAIVWHELHYGCALLPDSKRKTQLQAYLLTLQYSGLIILPYEQAAAEWFAYHRAVLKEHGKTAAYADGEIAAIAAVNNLTLVTRNTDDFSAYNNLLLDNWFE